MQQIQTPTGPSSSGPSTSSASAPGVQPAAPPPLPLPASTGGHEEVPAEREEREDGCVSALGSPLRTYLVFMAFFTVLWAVGGGGHFWPVWPMLGWGMGLVISGQVPIGRPRR